MRWTTCLAIVLVLSSCDDSTGPGGGTSPGWEEIALPDAFDEGVFEDFASGSGRLVALVADGYEGWVLEERAGQWEVVLDAPLPAPAIEPFFRGVPLEHFALDVVVDGQGRVVVVGRAPDPDLGAQIGLVPALWVESAGGWQLHYGPLQVGQLEQATRSARGDLLAFGTASGKSLVVEGSPERGFEWTEGDPPGPQPVPLSRTVLSDIALHRYDAYLSAYRVESVGSDVAAYGEFYVGDGGGLRRIEAPCGNCPGLQLNAVEATPAGLYWAGTRYSRTAEDPAARGWLALYEPAMQRWTEIELPPEIARVHDVHYAGNGALYLAAGFDRPWIWRRAGIGFQAEPGDTGAWITALGETRSGRIRAGGQDTGAARGQVVLFGRGR